MKLRETIKAIMDFSQQHNADINNSYIRMSHLISNGSITDIKQSELDNAHEFIKVHYNLAVDARKGKNLDKYNEALEAWQS